jgi:DivIVA domain-containing protein
MADRESRKNNGHEKASRTDGQGHRFFELRHYVPQEILDVSFPVAVRGYDRAAVDAYVKRVNRVIAELKVSASPPHAVRHALEEAEAKVQGLLMAAREAADEITASARQDAEQFTGRAKAEAADLVVDASEEAEQVKAEAAELLAKARAEAATTIGTARAEAEKTRADANAEAESKIATAQVDVDERRRRLQEELAERRAEAETKMSAIQADTNAVRDTRHELLGDIGRLASTLHDLAAAAGGRFEEPKPDD